LPFEHTVPHDPQFLSSVWMFTQRPPHRRVRPGPGHGPSEDDRPPPATFFAVGALALFALGDGLGVVSTGVGTGAIVGVGVGVGGAIAVGPGSSCASSLREQASVASASAEAVTKSVFD
jgi:hypothetical protein